MEGRERAVARFVAGLLPTAPDARPEVALAQVLSPEVWWRADRARLPKPQGLVPVEWLAPWRDPGELADADVLPLAGAWLEATAALPAADFVRVAVDSRDRAVVPGIAAAAGLRVVPHVAWLTGTAFSWHCPIRVTASGDGAGRLLAGLTALPLAGEYFDVVADGPADVCFLSEFGGVPAGCASVVVIGDADPYLLFGNGVHNPGNGVAVCAGVPRTDLGWWPEVVRALAANLPLDCALASVVPEAWVGGISAALTASTLEPSREGRRWRGPATEATFSGPGTEPAEGPALDQSLAEPPEPAPAGADPRRLVAEFRDGDRRVRTVLPPQRPLTLEVAIAVPRRGQPSGGTPVPHPAGADGVVPLEVVASGSVWPEPQRAQIAWSVDDVGEPSTSAVFGLTSPASGEVVDLAVTVLYQGRPLQRANVVAAVREAAVPGERVRVLVRSTSTPPSPALIATPAGVSLDATGSDLRNTLTGASLPLAQLDGALDALEQRISRTLGVEDAPESLSDPRALDLLVDLARRGAGLHDQLAGLGLQGPTAISLLVQPQGRLLPLELVYAGAVPRRRGVRLCDHVAAPPAPGEACGRTSSRTVCPYAFWALSRTILRSVLLPGPGNRSLPQRLDLQPLLYAAAARADRGSPRDRLPSDVLAAACLDLFGSAERVTSWTAWRRRVAALQPELLVLLAHTETDAGEASVQIGRRSFLARPDITPAMVGRGPLVVLIACASAVAGDEFGTLAGTLTARGAAAVVGVLAKLAGPQGSRAAVAVLQSLHDAGRDGPQALGAALASARRDLVGQGLLLGMMLVAHGEVDVKLGG